MQLANVICPDIWRSGPVLMQGERGCPLDDCYAGQSGPSLYVWEGVIAHLTEHGGPTGWDEQTAFTAADTGYQPPLTERTRIFCVGLNYRDHAAEGKQEVPEHPVFFLRLPSSFVGHLQPLILPRASSKFDYEGELAVVIGREARHVSEAEAHQYIFGYTTAMDGSLRDFQRRTPQWTLGKNFDRSGALGPVIVSADALPPGATGLAVRTYVNGERLQDGNTGDMIFSVARLIAELSQVMRLNPGDVILTGTPAGVGFARKPPIWLKEGDEVRVEIAGIPTLQNRVASEPELTVSVANKL